jgi:cytochrome c oxidase assembly protein subunit 15
VKPRKKERKPGHAGKLIPWLISPGVPRTVWFERGAWTLVVLTVAAALTGAVGTSTGAGLAIPDWPTSFGYVILPPQHWVPGWPGASWDLFWMQTHRLLGAISLLVAAVLVPLAWGSCFGQSARWAVGAAFGAILFQHVLGAWRVLGQSVVAAQLLALWAPVVIATTTAAGVLSNPARLEKIHFGSPGTRPMQAVAALLLLWVVVQIFSGVQLRHVAWTESPYLFNFWVWVHVLSGLALGAATLGLLTWAESRRRPGLGWESFAARLGWMVSILIFQVVLGSTVWLSQYGVPLWWSDWVAAWHLALQSPDLVFVGASVAHVIGGMITFLIAISLGISPCRMGARSVQSDWITAAWANFRQLGPVDLVLGWLVLLAGLSTGAPPNVPLVKVVDTSIGGGILLLTGLLSGSLLAKLRLRDPRAKVGAAPRYVFLHITTLTMALTGIGYLAARGYLGAAIWAVLGMVCLATGRGSHGLPTVAVGLLSGLGFSALLLVGAACGGSGLTGALLIPAFIICLLQVEKSLLHGGSLSGASDHWDRVQHEKSPSTGWGIPTRIVLMIAASGQFFLAIGAVILTRWPVGYAAVWLAAGAIVPAWTAGSVLSPRIDPRRGLSGYLTAWQLLTLIVWTIVFLPK